LRKLRRRIGLRSEPKKHWLVWAARFGYAACGFIYTAIGIVAIAVTLGLGETPTGSHGVLRFLARQPFAPLLLTALGIGLIGYAALNITGAISDPEKRGVSLNALILRTVDILTGALYIGLAFTALGLLVGSTESHDVAGEVARIVASIPFGRTIMVLTGGALIVSSVYLFIRAATEEFGEMLDRRALSKQARALIMMAARAGTAARGVVFALTGVFAIKSALARSPERVADVGDALAAIGHAFYGQFLLALMGTGFIAYGVYQFSKAGYQRVVAADN
jgi:hypothetical protein